MRSWFDVVVRANLYKIVIGGLFLLTALFTWLSFAEVNVKLAALYAGVATGLFVAALQYLIRLNEHRDVAQFKRLAIREVLAHREGKEYYAALIRGARRQVWVLGNTANRFLEDFAHPTREDSRVLLDALGRGVEVRILLPTSAYLNAADQSRSAVSHARMEELRERWPTFAFRFFDHRPAHSLVRVDDDCLIGPVFPHVQSKDSPAIHTYISSPFVAHYLTHFEQEWSAAEHD